VIDNKEKLRECPFCGGSALLRNSYSDQGSTIRCVNYANDANPCQVGPDVYEPAPAIPHNPDDPQSTCWLDFDASDRKAIERWNTRYEAAAHSWIAIEDGGLPKEEGPYIVTAHWSDEPLNCAFTEERVFYTDTQTWEDEEPGAIVVRKIIAWMPLPQPFTKSGGNYE
jgi:hypothetical protein